MEAKRRQLMQANEAHKLAIAAKASTSPRSTMRPLPRRNATPAQTPSRKDPHQTQHSLESPTIAPPSLSAPVPGSAAAPPSPARATTPPRIGKTSSTPLLTCKDWDFQAMLDAHRNFRPVRRISALVPPDALLRELTEYEKSGEPLIIENWHKHPKWQGDLLGMEWLLAHAGQKEIPVRNVHDRKDTTMTLSQFIERSREQDVHHVSGESERYYWKDGECPSQWKDWLKEILPAQILPGCRDDLLRHLFPSEAVETLLCYLGIGDTYTPAHKDLCASSGHNLMCFSENGGSSFWFMTKSDAAPKVAEYFQKELGQELDWETHVTSLDEWGKAKFEVHVAEQKVGDLVLVPPRSVHQVVNRGGLAMKTSWSRMTLINLTTALRNELPIYRRVCRLEQYRVKTVLYRSLLHYTDQLRSALEEGSSAPDASGTSSRTGLVGYGSSIDSREEEGAPPMQPPQTKEQLAKTLLRLVRLFDDVLYQEYAQSHDDFEHITRSEASSRWSLSANDTPRKLVRIVPPSPTVEKDRSDDKGSCNLACDFCGADIFQSFFECRQCRADGAVELQIGDGLLVCPACYVEGRTCSCDEMEPRQCRPFDVLLHDRNEAASVLARGPLAPSTSGKSAYPLDKMRLRDRDMIRVFEAACVLQKLKIRHPAEKLHGTRRCRSGDPKNKSHEIKFISGLGCTTCHGTTCYAHLVHAGTHCAEALLASRVNDVFYHELHRENGKTAKQHPPALYDVRGSDIKDRLVVAAISFPRCKPGHSKLQLGWYDQELEVTEPVNDVQAPQPAVPEELNSQSIFREDSPLTPVSSPAKSDSTSSSVVQTSAAARPKRIIPADNSSVISIDSDSDDDRDVTVPVARSSSPIKHKQNRAYVELTSMASLRRTSSPASMDLESRRKKPRVDQDAEGTTRPAGLHTSVGDKPVGMAARGRIGKSYGTNLVEALSRANSTVPIFTQPTLSDRPKAQKKSGVRRIISPDPERSSAQPVGNEPSTSSPRLSTEVSVVHKTTASSRDAGTPMLPASQGRVHEPTSRRSFPSSSTTSTTAPKQAPTPKLPRKRKRTTGPPGVREQDFLAHVQRVKQGRWVAEEPRKKARLQEDEEERMQVDVLQEVPVHSQAAPPSSRSVTNESSAAVTVTRSHASHSQNSSSSLSSLAVSTQTVGASQEPPTSSHIPHAPVKDASSVPGPSQASPPQHPRPSASASVSSSMKTLMSTISNPLRALADTIDACPDLLQQRVSPELEQAMQQMHDKIRDQHGEIQALQSCNTGLERRLKSLEDDKATFQQVVQSERHERGLQAHAIRGLDDRMTHLEGRPPPFDVIHDFVRRAVMELIPSLRLDLQEVAKQAVQDAVRNIVQERVTMALGAPLPQPPANMPVRQQIEPAKPIPQGPHGFSERSVHNRQHGGGGRQRSHVSRSQDEYQRNRDGRYDDSRFRSSSRHQASGSHGGNRDEDRQFHPPPTSSGGYGSAEGSRSQTNTNNWSRRHDGQDHNRDRQESPRRSRPRSRSTDRRVPIFNGITADSELVVPRLRTANWSEQPPPTSSIGQFDDADEMRAVGGSSTDPEASPIEEFPSSVKSRSHSEIQDSSLTERGSHDKASKPPTGPRERRRASVSSRTQKTRPIRQ